MWLSSLSRTPTVDPVRPYLVETGGSHWEWHQFPGQLVTPVHTVDGGAHLISQEQASLFPILDVVSI